MAIYLSPIDFIYHYSNMALAYSLPLTSISVNFVWSQLAQGALRYGVKISSTGRNLGFGSETLGYFKREIIILRSWEVNKS
jgi:hypothetical protein